MHDGQLLIKLNFEHMCSSRARCVRLGVAQPQEGAPMRAGGTNERVVSASLSRDIGALGGD